MPHYNHYLLDLYLSLDVNSYLVNDNIIDPKEAAYIDRKLDDGFPHTGTIQAYGNGDYCYRLEGSGYVYDEAITTKSCGLYIKIKE